MSKSLTSFFLAMFFVLTGCGSKETAGNTATVVNNNRTETTTTTKPINEPANTIAAASGDKIGVAECDEYIAKVEACLFKKVPEANRQMYQPSLEQMKKSWKDAAATQQGKAALASGCKQALETAKQSYAAFSCDF